MTLPFLNISMFVITYFGFLSVSMFIYKAVDVAISTFKKFSDA